MTINEQLAAGGVIHDPGKGIHETEPDEAHPYGRDQVLFEGHYVDLHAPVERDWADRPIRYIWPVPGEGIYPTLVFTVE